MDIRTYIESGILEEYVLGSLTPEMTAEVEEYARLYPAVKQELNAIEQALEQYAILHAKTPPPGTLDNILKRIDAASPAQSVVATPASSLFSRLRPRSWSRFLAVGMTIKFLLAAGGLIFLYLQNQKLHQRIEGGQEQIIRAQAACDSVSTLLERELRFLKDVDTRPVAMIGTPIAPEALAAVHFNPKERKAYLTNIDLPKPPAGKQYQLWAIVEGTPVSMGVFVIPEEQSALLEVPFVENATAYAISLEDLGGKPLPTSNQIYVMGAVTG